MSLMVDLGERSYPIDISAGSLTSELMRTQCEGKKLLLVTNETIAPLYLEQLQTHLSDVAASVDVVLLKDGEQYKTMQALEAIFDQALTARLNRSSLFVALGGGVVGDMTGFAAACYQRGVDFIQVPTTLLSQVDSSVGGKTGVNHPMGKNMIGAFHQPISVFIDTNTLDTLPDREFSGGWAEVIKYGFIADAAFLAWLHENIDALMARDKNALEYAIRRSCEIKADVVAKDEKEGGIRAILNLGHTFGHAIEANEGYGNWLHGEAVSVGMIMALDLSFRQGAITQQQLEQSIKLLEKANLPLKAPKDSTVEGFINVMAVDKKNVSGNIRLVLVKSLGDAYVTDLYDVEMMRDVISDNIQK